MTSFIQVNRICEYCSREFLSKTTVTRFCSKTCRSRSNKARIRHEKIQESNKELIQHKSLNLELIKTKEFLKVKEVAALLDCSIRSVYYYIDQGVIEAMNIGHRMTRVKRASLEKLIGLKVNSQEDEISLKKEYTIEDCISTYEIRKKFGISESALRDLIIRNNIPKLRNGSFAFVPKVEIEKYLGIRIEI